MENKEQNKSNLPADNKTFKPASENQNKNEKREETTVTTPSTGNGTKPGEQKQEVTPDASKKISDTPDKNDTDSDTVKNETSRAETIDEITDAEEARKAEATETTKE